MFYKLLILIIFVVSMAGCTSMRPVDMAQADYAKRLETGDRLVVYEKHGRIIDMKLTQVEEGILYGSLTNNGLETVEVELAAIEKIEIEKISGAKTT